MEILALAAILLAIAVGFSVPLIRALTKRVDALEQNVAEVKALPVVAGAESKPSSDH